tara:strand:- start:18899 stop:19360 length:462 start_codon:yes stop_codon:yes gene_type:complete
MDVDGDNDMVIKKPYVNVKKDYDWGIAKEPIVIKELSKIYPKRPEFKKLGKYDHFDYCSWDVESNIFVEIKSRRNAHDAYDETIVPSIKIRKALRLVGLGHKALFVINFTDGIYYVDFEKASMRFGYNARTDRGAIELSHYAFIPMKQFKQLQ